MNHDLVLHAIISMLQSKTTVLLLGCEASYDLPSRAIQNMLWTAKNSKPTINRKLEHRKSTQLYFEISHVLLPACLKMHTTDKVNTLEVILRKMTLTMTFYFSQDQFQNLWTSGDLESLKTIPKSKRNSHNNYTLNCCTDMKFNMHYCTTVGFVKMQALHHFLNAENIAKAAIIKKHPLRDGH